MSDDFNREKIAAIFGLTLADLDDDPTGYLAAAEEARKREEEFIAEVSAYAAAVARFHATLAFPIPLNVAEVPADASPQDPG